MKRCPVCGYHAVEGKKAYRLEVMDLFNEPEICDFMTNNLKGG